MIVLLAARVDLEHVLIVGAVLFAIGLYVALTKRNAVAVIMGIELMLNASNLAFVTLAQAWGRPEGIAIFIFIITVAAAEAGIGLALFIKMFHEKETIAADAMTMLHD